MDRQLQHELSRLYSGPSGTHGDTTLSRVMPWLQERLRDLIRKTLFAERDEEANQMRQQARAVFEIVDEIDKAHAAEQARRRGETGISGGSPSVV